jgi:glycosyltransferase involved in cell wall biosynthesis
VKNIGIFVGEKGKWTFFEEIYQDLCVHYNTDVFEEKYYRIPLLNGRMNRWAYQNRMRSILRRNDLCFFEWSSELLATASHMPKYCPIMTRLHSYEITYWAPKIDWGHVDKVIVLSQSMQQKFAEAYPEHARKATVVHNGVSLTKFSPPPQRKFQFTLGMLCNIHPIKRIYDVVILIHKLRKSGYRPNLRVAGGRWEGGYFDDYFLAINRAIAKLGLSDCVTLDGYVDDTTAWLQGIDIFISNSYWEGQQTALLEAMATGCYCLSHFWDGAEEILPSENLYITEAELETKIIEYCNLPDCKRRDRQLRMRAIACEKFNIDQTKAQIHQLLEEIYRVNGVSPR